SGTHTVAVSGPGHGPGWRPTSPRHPPIYSGVLAVVHAHLKIGAIAGRLPSQRTGDRHGHPRVGRCFEGNREISRSSTSVCVTGRSFVVDEGVPGSEPQDLS